MLSAELDDDASKFSNEFLLFYRIWDGLLKVTTGMDHDGSTERQVWIPTVPFGWLVSTPLTFAVDAIARSVNRATTFIYPFKYSKWIAAVIKISMIMVRAESSR
jgi:hypothetical protein